MINKLKFKGKIGFFIAVILTKIYRFLNFYIESDEIYLTNRFVKNQGYSLNLKNPKSLNEKIQWLKINDRKEISKKLADKYAVREYIKENFGEEFLIPFVLETKNIDDIKFEKLPVYPFIIKANHDSGNYLIVKDKSKVNWKKEKINFKWWLSFDYFYNDREWQYKNMERRIIIEKLLICNNGKIPNDYKVHCINGKVEFIYVSIDREVSNKRNIYDREWKPLYFTWAHKTKNINNLRGEEISPPLSLEKMIVFAEKIAQIYDYIRVDFYDVDGKLYFGEVTQHHGGGWDKISPIEFDYKYGEMLKNSC